MISHNNDVSYIVSQKYTFISNKKKFFVFVFFHRSWADCFLSFLLLLFFVFFREAELVRQQRGAQQK